MHFPIAAAFVRIAMNKPSGDLTKQLFSLIETLLLQNKTLSDRLTLIIQRHGLKGYELP